MQIELNLGHLPVEIRQRAEEAVDEYITECMIEDREIDPDEIFELICDITEQDP